MMPRLLEMNWSSVMRFLIWLECASVLSMMIANARTYAASELANTLGFCAQYAVANDSMMRSIFCASPGSRKGER